jgi:hypothetical protein
MMNQNDDALIKLSQQFQAEKNYVKEEELLKRYLIQTHENNSVERYQAVIDRLTVLENFRTIETVNEIKFSSTPVKNLKLVLPANIHPGFCHNISAMSSTISYCLLKDYAFFLDDSIWKYGKWDQYLKIPFMNQPQQRYDILVNPLSLYPHSWGMLWGVYPAVQKIYKSIFRLLYQPAVTLDMEGYQNIDLAMHIRTGDHGAALTIDEYKRRVEPIVNKLMPEKIFIMTDQRKVVDEFEKHFGRTMLSLCPLHYTGEPRRIRDRSNVMLLMREIQIASQAKYFIASRSEISYIITTLRDNYNVMPIN